MHCAFVSPRSAASRYHFIASASLGGEPLTKEFCYFGFVAADVTACSAVFNAVSVLSTSGPNPFRSAIQVGSLKESHVYLAAAVPEEARRSSVHTVRRKAKLIGIRSRGDAVGLELPHCKRSRRSPQNRNSKALWSARSRPCPPTLSVNALARQSFEQSRRGSQIHGREAFGKSLIHGRKRVSSLFAPILRHAQPGDTKSSTQLPEQRVLLPGQAKRLSETILG